MLLTPLAFGALGEDATSVQKDAENLGAQKIIQSFSHYSRHDISNQWLGIHEFVGKDGKVFALTWHGNKHPDFKNLLGSHFAEFQAAIAQARRQRIHGGASIVEQGNLHLEIGGRMRSVYGKVWLTDKIPAGVEPHEFQ